MTEQEIRDLLLAYVQQRLAQAKRASEQEPEMAWCVDCGAEYTVAAVYSGYEQGGLAPCGLAWTRMLSGMSWVLH